MANVFDFELTADENATKTLADIESKLKQLNPLLNTTRDGLRLGGNETLENAGSLSNRLRDMARNAQDNVQNIGDMIPPLKMFGELSGKYLGMGLKLGGIGAVGYGITKMAQHIGERSKQAYDLDVMAKNNNMTTEEFSRLSGAMVILGANADEAKSSVDGLYQTFNDPLWARNDAALAQLNGMGVSIIRKEDGTADVMKTMEELTKVFPTFSSAKQKTISDFLGLDANTLALLRQGARYKELLTKSEVLGLTVPEGLNQQLTELNGTLSLLNASWEGFKQRSSNAMTNFLLSDGSINDGLKGVSDLLTYGPDNFAITRTLGFTRGDESDQMRWGYNTPEFYNALSTYEKTMLDFGLITDGYREKYKKWHEKKGNEKLESPLVPEQQKSYKDIYKEPANFPKNSGVTARGIRNNNPGNLVAAPNAVGKDFGNHHTYVKFATAHDGLSAMARQIMLDAERGLNTVSSLLNKYAPPNKSAPPQARNNTPTYIRRVSQQAGYSPHQRIDMHNPAELKKLMSAMITVENKSNPYSDKQISTGIAEAIHGDRWKGLRNPKKLTEQRQQYNNGLIEANLLSFNQPHVDKTRNLTEQQESLPANEPRLGKPPSDEPKQPFPSLYGKKKEVEYEVEIAKGMAKAVQDSVGDNPLQVEITLVNDKTGERQVFQSKTAGKVTTSMRNP
ncbi:hypothetical protein [Xenorhabdus sp. Sc-CR9]|nr:hypothetical protein [Xenorhabdus sp. Sc-CR9]